jgi:hypothetical protein
VQEFKSKPFTMLGVNSDPKDKLKKLIAGNKVTWTCIWDGGDSWGPVATSWNVRWWPKTYVIDRSGVIRCKDERPENLHDLLKKLIAEKP